MPLLWTQRHTGMNKNYTNGWCTCSTSIIFDITVSLRNMMNLSWNNLKKRRQNTVSKWVCQNKLSRFGAFKGIFTLGAWTPARLTLKSNFLIRVNTSMPYFGMKTIMPSYCCNYLSCFGFFSKLQSVLNYVVMDLVVPRLHHPHRVLRMSFLSTATLSFLSVTRKNWKGTQVWVCSAPEDQSEEGWGVSLFPEPKRARATVILCV